MPPADRPGRARLVRVLAVLAALATIPLWSPPVHVTTAQGIVMVAAEAPPGVRVVRLVALVLVVGLTVATLAVGGRVALLYLVPAAALSWVVWRTDGGGGYTVGMFGSMGQQPPHAFQSPWLPVAVALIALLVLTWSLGLLGLVIPPPRRTPRGARRSGRTA